MNAPRELVDVGTLERGSYIGGGDIAAIIGVNPYRTPYDVYLSKIGEAPPAKPDPQRDARLKRGKLWEPIVVQMLREEHGIEIVAQNARYVDPEFAYMAAEIDFEWTRDGAPVMNGEIKSVHPLAAKGWGDAESDEVPMQYAAQSMWGLMVTGRELCQYGVVFGADDLTLYHVRADDETIEWLRTEARRFWNEHVLKRIPPPPKTFGDLAKRWPRDRGTTIECTPEIAAMFSTWQALKERERVGKEGAEAVEFEIAEFMKDNTQAALEGLPLFTYKAQSAERIAATELRAALPDIAKQFTRTSEFRVLRKATKRG